jgi:hypothetical protein
LFAGQPDSQDESHFTIGYAVRMTVDDDWTSGVIDGWLHDDDSLELRVRDGPLRLAIQQ